VCGASCCTGCEQKLNLLKPISTVESGVFSFSLTSIFDRLCKLEENGVAGYEWAAFFRSEIGADIWGSVNGDYFYLGCANTTISSGPGKSVIYSVLCENISKEQRSKTLFAFFARYKRFHRLHIVTLSEKVEKFQSTLRMKVQILKISHLIEVQYRIYLHIALSAFLVTMKIALEGLLRWLVPEFRLDIELRCANSQR
jgi:hypothetical protein